jgi:alpha-L-fucosidase
VITSDGLVPEVDARRLREFGREIGRRFGKALAETSGEGEEVELRLPRPKRIAHVVIMEDIPQGERIRQYVVEGLVAGDRWEKLAEGQSVGHKRIERFAPVEVARVRLKVTNARARPIIRKLAVYAAGG